jgi:hypothetical protein
MAVEAARSMGLVAGGPVGASLLHWSAKSLVVRIRPPGMPAIVAKRSRRLRALAEARVYDEVLSLLSEGHVRLLDRSAGDEVGWLFLEDAGDVAVDRSEPTMRRELGGLLGRFATLSSRIPLNGVLPHYTSEYFAAVLADTQLRLKSASGISDSSRGVVNGALHRLHRIEASWGTIANVFAEGPVVLCHADVQPKNLRVRGSSEREVTLLDWEKAGHGPLAVDLGCLAVTHEHDPVLVGFGREFGGSERMLFEQACIGRILRLLHAMFWAAKDLNRASAERGVRLVDTYCEHVDRSLAQLPYGRGRTNEN